MSADYMCAMSLAFGVSSALLRRERTGRGGSVDVSLMQAAMTLANNQLVRSEVHDAARHKEVRAELEAKRADNAPFAEQMDVIPSARAMPLLKVYFRTYETADLTIAVACGSQKLRESFVKVTGLDDPGLFETDLSGWGPRYDALQAEAEALFLTRSAGDWVAALSAAGVPVSAVQFPLELFDDDQATANGMFHVLPHPTAGDVTVLAPPVRLDGDGFTAGYPIAPFGSETESLLGEIGIDADQAAALIEAGVTHNGEAAPK